MSADSAPPRPDSAVVPTSSLRRSLLAALSGAVVLAVVLVAAASGVLTGIPAVVLFVLAWALVPTADTLSRRLALNGAFALGTIPLLWWVRWPEPAGLGSAAWAHADLILGAALAACAAIAVRRPRGWRALVPRVAPVDLLPALAVGIAAWLLGPLLTARGGPASAAMLLQVTAGDNVSHFHMFEQTRRLGVAGFGWGGDAPHGGGYPFANYPQHFHSFAVFVSELIGPAQPGSIESEAALFLVSGAVTLLFALGTLAAAISAISRLRRRPGVALVVVAATVSVLFAGFGATSVRYGFEPFQEAVIASALVLALVAGSGRMRLRTFAAVVSGIVVVGFTWTLAVTLVLPALVAALALLPGVPAAAGRRVGAGRAAAGRAAPGRAATGRAGAWRARRVRIPVLALLAALAIAGVVATVAGLRSVAGVGGAGNALGLDGSVPAPPAITAVVIAAAMAVAVLLGRGGSAGRERRREGAARPFRRPRRRPLAFAIGGAALLGVAEYLALLLLGYAASGELGYYPVKFLGALFLVLVPVTALGVGLLVTRRRPPSRTVAIAAAVGGAVLALVASGLPVVLPAPAPAQSEGAALRAGLEAGSQRPTPATLRLLAAARLMRDRPCGQPVYLAPASDDLPILNGAQWALSLSRTWSDADLPIGRLLKREGADGNGHVDVSALAIRLLSGHPSRCLIAGPATIGSLDADVRSRFAAQLEALPVR